MQYSLGQGGLIKPAKKGPFSFGNIRDDTTRHRRVATTFVEPALTPFEILNRAFVLLRCSLAVECAEIFSFARSRIFLAGIQPVTAGFQFPNHTDSLGDARTSCACRATKYSQRARNPRPLNCRATPSVAVSRRAAERPPYKDFLNRFENPSTSSPARIARLVAR